MYRQMWEKFKTLSAKGKVEIIWEYYRWPILITLVVAILLGSWIYDVATAKDPYMNVEMINAYGRTPDGEAFQSFLEQEGKEYFDGAVVVNKQIQFGGEDPSLDGFSNQMLMCITAAGEGDLFFWNTKEIPAPLTREVLIDLREILPAEILSKYQDQLICAEGTDIPIAIYLEQNPWITENKYYVNCYVGVPFSVHDRDLVRDFLISIL